MNDPWTTRENEWIDDMNRWPKPFWHRLVDFWMRVDSTVVEILKGNTYE